MMNITKKQKKKTVIRLKYLDSCKKGILLLNMLTMLSLFIFNSIMYKGNNEGAVINNNQIHNYNTRNNSKISVPSQKTTLFEKSQCFTTAK
jgi:hypothetical protein